MKLAPISVAQMREVDRLMIEEYGITLPQMMEHAGRALAELARRYLGGTVADRRVVVLVGPGNNGGGGMVAARLLATAGASVAVALTRDPPLPGNVPEQQRRILERMAVASSDRGMSPANLPALLGSADLLVDALLGYSGHGPPREPVASFIHSANAVMVPRLTLDLPSGLDGDTGLPASPTVQATATLTLAWPKAGLLAQAAAPVVGQLFLADISVPAAVYQAVGVERGTLFSHGPIVRLDAVAGGWQADTAPRW